MKEPKRETLSVAIALIVPQLGGGTTRHVVEMAGAWSRQGFQTLLIETTGRLLSCTVWKNGTAANPFVFPFQEAFLLRVFRSYHVGLLHFHNMYTLYEPMLSLPERVGLPYVVTLHDYFTICPIIQLTDTTRRYCGEPSEEAKCDSCVTRRSAEELAWRKYISQSPIPIHAWRSFWAAWLGGAARVFVPHEDVRVRMKRYFPQLPMEVLENPEVVCPVDIGHLRQVQTECHREVESLRVACIGGLGLAKGGGRLLACARLAEKRHLPITFVLFGTLHEDVSKRYGAEVPSNLIIRGAYEESTVYADIVAQSIDFFWFPVILPETYSYTLSIPIRLGIPVFGADIGAIGARIRAHGWGRTYPWDLPEEELLERLLQFDFRSVPKTRLVLENTAYPPVTEVYRGILKSEVPEGSAVPIERLRQEAAHLCKTAWPRGLDGREWKLLLAENPSVAWKIRYTLGCSPQAVWTFLRKHSVMEILGKIGVIFQRRDEREGVVCKTEKSVMSTRGGQKSS